MILVSKKHTLFTYFLFSLVVACYIVAGNTESIGADFNPISDFPPMRYSHVSSLSLHANNIQRESFTTFVVKNDGSFAIKYYDKTALSNSAVPLDPEQTWENTPYYFIYFDGERSFVSSDVADPSHVYEKVILQSNQLLGESIHLKLCIWPLINELFSQGTWESMSRSLVVEQLSLKLNFDSFGRLLETTYSPPVQSGNQLIARWEFKGYDTLGNNIYPSSMNQSFVLSQDGEITSEEFTHYQLKFDENPSTIEQLIHFNNNTLQLDLLDRTNGDVFSPKGQLLYNRNELQDEYYRAVGLKDPIRTRNILFAIIGVLGIGSIIILKRRAA